MGTMLPAQRCSSGHAADRRKAEVVEACREAGAASENVGVGVGIDVGLYRQSQTIQPYRAAVGLVVLAVQHDPRLVAAGHVLVQIRPDDHVPAAKLIVEAVVGGFGILVRADGGEDGLPDIPAAIRTGISQRLCEPMALRWQ